MRRSSKKNVIQLGAIWTSTTLLSLSPFLALWATPAHGAGLAPASAPHVTTNTRPPAHTPTSLDLSSTHNSVNSRNTAPVNIIVGGTASHGTITGGKSFTIQPGQLVTPAQYAAVFEVVKGSQTLLLNAQGSAIGGFFKLNSSSVQTLSSLVVPKNVSLAAIGYGAASPLNVNGSVSDNGAIYTLQNAPGRVAVLNTGNLTVGSGAVLSGSMPTASNFGTGLYSSSGLNLNTSGNVLNSGTISSPGTLNISASGSISNQTQNNTQASITAQNVNLSTGNGQINNSGLIQASNNLNINTLNPGSNVVINNASGTLQASQINLLAAGADAAGTSVGVSGGLLSANGAINVFGQTMNIFPDQAIGPVNVTGSNIHLGVTEGSLQMGQQNVTGDPLYINTGTGSITLATTTWTGTNVNVTILATGPILTTGATTLTDNTGGSIYIASGVSFPGYSGANFNGTITNANGTTVAVPSVVLGGGGAISVGHTLNISASTGSVTVIAEGGAINTGTIAAGTGVTVIATGAVTTGAITNTSGSVTVASATPTLTGVSVAATTSAVSGTTTLGALSTGTVSTSSITAHNTATTLLTLPSQGVALITPPTLPTLNGATSVIKVVSTGAVTLNGDIANSASGATNSGGEIIISGSTITDGAAGHLNITASGGATSGDGGVISMTTSSGTLSLNSTGAGNFLLTASSVGSGSGGFIAAQSSGNLTLGSTAGISAAPATNGNGAQIYLASSGTVALPNSNFTADGVGTGSGGVLSIVGNSITLPTTTKTFSANGGTTGSGGYVNINQTGTTALAASNHVTYAAIGGTTSAAVENGGTIAISAGGNLTVASANISVAAGSGGASTGNGGSVLLTTTGAGTLGVTGGGITANKATTSGTGGKINISSAGALTVAGALIATGTSGGTVTVTNTGTSTIEVDGAITTTSGNIQISENSTTLLSINSGAPAAANKIEGAISGGAITVTNSGTGGISLSAATVAITGTTSVQLTAGTTGSITQTVATAAINSPSILLQSGSANIGTSTALPIVVENTASGNAVSLSGNTGGSANVFVQDISNATLTIQTISSVAPGAGGTFYANTNGGNSGTTTAGITVSSAITAPTITLTTAAAGPGTNNGNISFGALLNASTQANITAGGSGAISQSITTATVNSPSIVLQSGTGNVGTSTSAPIVVENTASGNAVSLTGHTGGSASVFVQDVSNAALTIQTISAVTPAAGGTFYANTNGNNSSTTTAGITVSSAVTAPTITFTTAAAGPGVNNGNISLGALLSASTQINLIAGGSGTVTQSIITATVNSPSIVLQSGTGNVGTSTSAPIIVENTASGNLVSLTGSTGGSSSVFVQDVSNATLTINTISSVSPSAGGTFFANSNGGNSGTTTAGITVSSAVTAPTITLTTTAVGPGTNNGNISLGALLNASTQANVSAGGSGTISQSISTATINSPSIVLQSGTGNIGVSNSAPIVVENTASGNAVALTGHTGGSASVFVRDISNAALTIQTISSVAPAAGGTFFANTNGNNSGTTTAGITVSSAITAPTITLTTAAAGPGVNNGNISLGALLNASTQANLTAGGSGSITQSIGTASINSPSVVLQSGTGNIGSTTTATLQLENTGSGNAVSFSANAGGTGSIFVQDVSNATLTVNAASSAGGQFVLTANGLTTSATISGSGGVTLNVAAGDTLNVGNSDTIQSSAGSITINADSINLGTGSTLINANSGTVNVVPSTNGQAVQIGGTTGAYLNDTELGQISAATLQVGNNNNGYAGDITLGHTGTNPINVAGSYNLSLLTGGHVNTSGVTIITGTKDLTINAQSGTGVSATIDTITGTGGIISITGAHGVTLNSLGAVATAGAGTISITANGGTITGNSDSISTASGSITVDNTAGDILSLGATSSSAGGSISIGDSSGASGITTATINTSGTVQVHNSSGNISTGNIGATTAPSTVTVQTGSGSGTVTTGTIDASTSISVQSDSGALKTGNIGSHTAPSLLVSLISNSSTIGSGSITATGATGNVTLVQGANSTLTLNSGSNTDGNIAGTISTGGRVVVTNVGGIILAGSGNAISAGSIGLKSNGGSITADAFGDGGLNAPMIALSASTGVGSNTSSTPITITFAGTTTLGSTTSGETNLNVTGGNLIVAATTVGSVVTSGITSSGTAGSILVNVVDGSSLTINTGAPISTGSAGFIQIIADTINLGPSGVLINASSTGFVGLTPATPSTAIQVDGSNFSQIQTKDLEIGSGSAGNITLGANITNGTVAAGTLPGSFNLSLKSGALIDTQTDGFSISSGLNNITLNSLGGSISTGVITTTGGNISMTATNAITLNSGISTQGSGTLTLHAGGGAITGNGVLIGAGSGTITIDNTGGDIASLGPIQSTGAVNIGNASTTGITTSTIDTSGAVIVTNSSGNINTGNIGAATAPSAVTVTTPGTGTVSTGSIDASGAVSVSSTSGALTVGTIGATAHPSGVTLTSTGNTISTGAITASGNVVLSQNSSTALTLNPGSTSAGDVNGVVSTSGFVTASNIGSGGIVLAGSGTAVTASAIGLSGGSGGITTDISGDGGLSAANIALVSSAGVGSITGALPITITTAGTTTIAASNGSAGEVNLVSTSGGLTVGAVTAGTVSATGINAGTNVFLRVPTGNVLNINTGAPVSSSNNGTITINADTITLGTGTLISAGNTGSVFITPSNSGGSVGMQLNGSSFNSLTQILAQNVQFGNNSGYTGNITLGASITNGSGGAPGSAAGLFNLSLLTGGTLNTSGNSITSGSSNLTINATGGSGSVAVDSISSTNGIISISGATGVTLNNTVSSTGSGTISILASSGDITGNNKAISSGTGSITVDNTDGSITGLGAISSTGSGAVTIGDNITTFGTQGISTSTIDTAGAVNVQDKTSDILTGNIGGITEPSSILVQGLTFGQVTTGTLDSQGTIHILGTTGALTTGTIGGGVLKPTGVLIVASSNTISTGAITSTGTVSLQQNSSTALTLNAGSTAAGHINGVVSDSLGIVNVTNNGSGGIVVGGATNAVVANSSTFNSSGSITTSGAGGTISANTLTLNASSNIGTSGIGLSISSNAANLSATSNTSNVFLVDTLNSTVNVQGAASSVSGSGSFNLTTTGTLGAVTASGPITGVSGVAVVVATNNPLTLSSTNIIQTTGSSSQIYINADSLVFGGFATPEINAGSTGTVVLFPSNPSKSIQIDSTGTKYLTTNSGSLPQFQAANLQIGDDSLDDGGNITIGTGGLNAGFAPAGTAPGAFAVGFKTTANFTINTGNTLSIGSNNLNVTVQGDASIANITGSGGNLVFLTAGNNMALNGNIILTGGTLVTNTSGFTSTTGTVSASKIIFNSTSGIPIIVAGGNGGGASGYVLTGDFLQNVTANIVQVSNLSGSSITLQNGSITAPNINQLFFTTAGAFDGTAGTLSISPSTVLNVQATSSINTGSLIGGGLVTYNTSGTLNINGSLNMPSGTLVSSASTLAGGGSITANKVIFNSTGNALITVGTGSTGYIVPSSVINNITANIVQIGGGGAPITVAGTISPAHVNQLFFATSGAYDATGATINLGNVLNISASSINSGGISGGNQVTFNATGLLNINGTINMPGATVIATSNLLSGTNALTANKVILVSTNSQTSIGSGSGYIVPGGLLGNMTANQLQLNSGAPVTVNGTNSLTGINQFQVTSSGAYVGTGSTLNFSPTGVLQVFASSINTGGITGGASATLNASGALTLDGALTMPGAVVILNSASLSLSGGSINANKVVLNSTNNSAIAIGSGAGYLVSTGLLNSITASQVQIGGGSAPITATGTIDLSLSTIGTLVLTTSGAYDSSAANIILAPAANINIFGGASINLGLTGQITGGNFATLTSNGPLTYHPANLTSATVVLHGNPLNPIAFTQGGSLVSEEQLLEASVKNADVWQVEHSDLSLGANDEFIFEQGEFILNARSNCKIRFNDFVLNVSKGSVVLLTGMGDTLTVKNLHDQHSSAVIVSSSAGSGRLAINAGEEVIIGKNKDSVLESLNTESVARRNLVLESWGNKAFARAEFSMVSLGTSSPIVKSFLRNSRAKEVGATSLVLRTAACLNAVTAGHGMFR